MGITLSIVKFSLLVFNSLLLWFSLSTSTKMSPFLNFFILKGSDPRTATMALLTANGDSFDRGLSLSVPFTNRNHGHVQIGRESKFVVMKSGDVPVSHPFPISHLGILCSHNVKVFIHCQCSPPPFEPSKGIS